MTYDIDFVWDKRPLDTVENFTVQAPAMGFGCI
jgi:hypothetical protein